MILPNHFDQFLQNINVDPSNQNRARSTHLALRSALQCDQEAQFAIYETFLQGSYAHNTLVRPTGNDAEFDVDVCCSINLEAFYPEWRTPRMIVKWLANRLKGMPSYYDRVELRPRCIRLNYPGLFHMDVVPLVGDSRKDKSILLIPNRPTDGWEWTNPQGLAAWYKRINADTNGRFIRVAKMLKHWRNQVFSKRTKPPSVGLEVLIAKHWPAGVDSDAAAVAGVFQNISTAYKHLNHVPCIENPSLSEEDLLRDWTWAKYETFRNRVHRAAKLAKRALQEGDHKKSVALWQCLFVTSFPQRP